MLRPSRLHLRQVQRSYGGGAAVDGAMRLRLRGCNRVTAQTAQGPPHAKS